MEDQVESREKTVRERDPVIEAYKKDIDRTLLREALALTPQQRFERFERMMETVLELQEAGAKRRSRAL